MLGPSEDKCSSSEDRVSMGCGGSTEWMKDDYQQLYGNRCNLLSILSNPSAAGRTYAFHTTDEFIPASLDYLKAPMHIIGLITTNEQGSKQKLGVYTNWEEYSPQQSQAGVLNDAGTEVEYYDYSTSGGANELVTTPDSPGAQAALAELWDNGLPKELQAPVPSAYEEAQRRAYHELQNYFQLVNALSGEEPSPDVLEEIHQRVARAWAF